MAAGIFFTNNKLVLAGYQPNKKVPFIGGIGGKKQNTELYHQTAIRETLEELFDIKPSIELINTINTTILPQNVLITKNPENYSILIFSFRNLEQMLQILLELNIISPLYDIFPKNISELIFNRKDINSEITHLCLLPLKENLTIDNNFMQDIHRYLIQK